MDWSKLSAVVGPQMVADTTAESDRLAKRSPLLRGLEHSAFGGRFVPICGPVKGRAVYFLAKAVGAKKFLELGTAIGYSTIWLAEAGGKSCRIDAIDWDKRLVEEAKQNIGKAGFGKNVNFIVGDARKEIKKLRGSYDFIFLDVVKEHYLQLLPDCVRLLRKGGLLVADNVLWRELTAYRDAVCSHTKLDSVVLPVQDGLAASLKR